MKTLRFLILLGLVMVPAFAQSQDVQDYFLCPLPDTNSFVEDAGLQPSGSGYAEAITPDIQALANGLQDDPMKIFKYVHDHIKFIPYFGSMKGAELTLLEQSGNDFDQCALLAALLQAAGYSPGYEFSMVKVPYTASDGTQNDLQHWFGLSLANTNSTATYNLIDYILGDRGYPVLNPDDSDHYTFQHVWVTLVIGGVTNMLDPSFKVTEPLIGTNLASAMGVSSNALMIAAAGTDTANYVTNLNEANLRGTLTGYTTNLLNYLQSNCPNASVEQVLGGTEIVPYTNSTFSQTPMFPLNNIGGAYPPLFWTNEPTAFMSSFTVWIGTTNQAWYFPQLQGQELSLVYDNTGTATLWLGNSNVLQTANSDRTNVILTVAHPWGQWNPTPNNTPSDNGSFDQSGTNYYQGTNSNYAILYAFEPSVKWLNEEERQLDTYTSEGYSNTSPQVVNATLNVMGLEWMVQTKLLTDIIDQEQDLLPEYNNRVGRMAQEIGRGYYIDVYMQTDGTFPATGAGTADFQNLNTAFDIKSYIWSAMEHGVIEQLQNSNLVAGSTVKMLQIANTNHQAVYLADSSNWSTVEPKLVGYGSVISTLDNLISSNYYLLLPQNGSIPLNGSGSYTGYAYMELYPGSPRVMGMIIGGAYGGYEAEEGAEVNAAFTQATLQQQPDFFTSVDGGTPLSQGGDPVDLADGTFQVENTDLSLGHAEPCGITLSRYYNGTRRFSNVGGMTGGWIHNYCITAGNTAAPQAALGSTTPAQMASMLVTTSAALSLYNNSVADPKNWLVTALIAKWGVDQILTNGVSVNLGKDTFQFVQQPNGVFTPPANCTMTLAQTNSAYVLQMRHGNAFKFSSSGYLTNIVDQYGNGLNLTYNSSNRVSVVSDWKGRTMTFNYNPSGQLTNVADSGGRSVSYAYSTAYNSQGDLTSVTDPQGATNTYIYDTNHEITATFDALNRLVVTNFYDGDGHVDLQYTEGLTNKTWQIFWSGWQTLLDDPDDDPQTYGYDDQGRLISTQDALGNLSQNIYDGQNHIIETISPLNETNLFLFDGNNNLTNATDPLGFSTQYIYDGNNNLIETIDPRGNVSRFGYNGEFSLTGQTNGASDFVNYVYNSNGTLGTRTDSGGTTTYGYDTFGQLNSIAYPNSLGTDTFANSSLGDITNHTDARGFATAFQYNARRQLTNSIAPTNLVAKIAYDVVGNAANATDARGNITSQAWSATRHLLATTLPAMSIGTPVVTNIYDNREWLVGSIDPLQNSISYANDGDDRLLLQTDPLGRTTAFGYDGDSRQIAATNGAGEVTSQTWNAKSELIDLVDGAGHISIRAYDGAGNQIVLTNRNGNPWQFHFDGANRVTNTVSPRGRSATVAFNHQGLPTFITDPKGQVTTNNYDGEGRLTNRVDGVASTFYSYDPDNNLTNISEAGSTNSWTFDAYERVSSYKDVNGFLIQYRYDGNGNLTNLIYPGSRNVYYAYDSNDHLTNVTDWSGRVTTMTYDLDGRLSSITRPNGTYRTIGYDSAGEVTNILEQMANSLPIALMHFAWNSNSTMQWEFLAPQPHTNAPASRSMTYDADNELTNVDGNYVTVDNDGNLLSGALTNDTFATYTYDARNRLWNVGGVTNVYDAANNRIGQLYGTNSILYVVNPNSDLSQVLMRIKYGVTNYYVYGPGLLYQITEASTGTNTVTYHYDCRGSTIALTGDNGLVTDRMEYSLYATMTYRAGTNDTPFLFNGQYGVMTDPNGLLYMRARYYNPYLCRFINADPSGFKGGLNMYAFANGNPVSYLDPFGLYGYSTKYWADLSVSGSWWQKAAAWPLGILSAAVPDAVAVSGNGTGGFIAGGTVGVQKVWYVQQGVSQDYSFAGGTTGPDDTSNPGFSTPQVSVGIGISVAWSGTYNPAPSTWTGQFSEANVSEGTLSEGGFWSDTFQGLSIGGTVGPVPVSASYINNVDYQMLPSQQPSVNQQPFQQGSSDLSPNNSSTGK